jgi:hypothetical protein
LFNPVPLYAIYEALFVWINLHDYLAALTVWNVGPEGRGTSIFFAPWLPWVFLFIALFLLHVSESKIVIFIMMIAHYGLTLICLSNYWNDSYRGKSSFMLGWEGQRGLMIITFAWYLLGQIIIWVMFFKMQRNQPRIE